MCPGPGQFNVPRRVRDICTFDRHPEDEGLVFLTDRQLEAGLVAILAHTALEVHREKLVIVLEMLRHVCSKDHRDYRLSDLLEVIRLQVLEYIVFLFRLAGDGEGLGSVVTLENRRVVVEDRQIVAYIAQEGVRPTRVVDVVADGGD